MSGTNVFLTGLIILFLGLTLSCQRQLVRENLYQEIEHLQKQLAKAISTTQLDTTQAMVLIEKSEAYATNYAQDSLAPLYLFRAADVARGIGKYRRAIELWKRVEQQYPTFVKTPEALFFQGFTYENDLRQPTEAKKYYQLFLKKFPDHPLLPTVKGSLSNLSETPMELIEKFKKQQR